jgi:predicted DNA binding CopG/RHH family protein
MEETACTTRVDKRLLREVKAKAALEGMTLKEIVARAFSSYLKEPCHGKD